MFAVSVYVTRLKSAAARAVYAARHVHGVIQCTFAKCLWPLVEYGCKCRTTQQNATYIMASFKIEKNPVNQPGLLGHWCMKLYVLQCILDHIVLSDKIF